MKEPNRTCQQQRPVSLSSFLRAAQSRLSKFSQDHGSPDQTVRMRKVFWGFQFFVYADGSKALFFSDTNKAI